MDDVEFTEDEYLAIFAAEEAALAQRNSAPAPIAPPPLMAAIKSSPVAFSSGPAPRINALPQPKPPLDLRVWFLYYGDDKFALKVAPLSDSKILQELPPRLLDSLAPWAPTTTVRDRAAVQEASKRARTIPLLSYADKLLVFSMKYHEQLASALQSVVKKVEPIPKWILDVLRKGAEPPAPPDARGPLDLRPVGEKINSALLQFQRFGVEKAIRRGGRILLACVKFHFLGLTMANFRAASEVIYFIRDDMGLGKSIQALAIAAYYRQNWPLLIIVPASLRQVWADQVISWYTDITPDDIAVVMNAKNESFKKCRIVIISYELVDKIGSHSSRFSTVIVDESHSIKNWKAKRTKACEAVIRGAKTVIMLSGTPALSRPIELLTQLRALRPNLFSSCENFGARYCNPTMRAGYRQFDGCDNLEELHAVLRETVMIRRLKRDVLTELPKKTRHRVDVHVSKEQRNMIAEITKKLRGSGISSNSAKSSTSGAFFSAQQPDRFSQMKMVLELFNDSGRAKIQQVLEHIKTFLLTYPQEKLLVFGHNTDILTAVESLARKMKVGSIRIDGRTQQSSRYDLVKAFNEDDSIRVAILSMTAAGVGLTLTAACHVVFAQLFWNPGILVQCEDRVHRIGQKRPVTIEYIIAKDTFDEQLWELVEKKLGLLGTIFDGAQDSLDAVLNDRSAAPDEDSLGESDVPVDDSLLNWILQKAFSWDEREKKYQERKKARLAAAEADTDAFQAALRQQHELRAASEEAMLIDDGFDWDSAMALIPDPGAANNPGEPGGEEDEFGIVIEDETQRDDPFEKASPEYVPEVTRSRLSSFAFVDKKQDGQQQHPKTQCT